MRTADFTFHLPGHLIAQAPLHERSASRLLHLDGTTGATAHLDFRDLPGLLRPGDLLVLNDTRVIPARLLGEKASGGRVEVLIERVTGHHDALALVRASKVLKPGGELRLGTDQGEAHTATCIGRAGEFFQLRFADPVLAVLDAVGHVPLPPYIQRADDAADQHRYQTVFARVPGAVAAPTAGLHFDDALLAELRDQGVEVGYVTLHVGAGTFQPVRAEQVEDHHMHHERYNVPPAVVRQVAAARQAGGRVVAVGTTALRALEAAAADGALHAGSGDTDLFITPGYRFQCVDALVTNFHLPESTLLMLVSAFAGRDAVLAAYAEAVELEYRFFSYGDAMFITRAAGAGEGG